MRKVATIGILGGMGPDATNRLAELIALVTPAVRDQDHVPVITYNNPMIPSRVHAIMHGGESPLGELVRTAQVLETAGAGLLVMPCNCAHYYVDEIQESVQIPIVNMIEETVNHVIDTFPEARKVGLLASTATLASGLYHEPFARHDRIVLIPSLPDQQTKVMDAIYGPWGIKAGFRTKPRVLLFEAAQSLIDGGADLIIAGCTEISLVMLRKRSSFPVVDPMDVVARVAVGRALAASDERQRMSCPQVPLTLVIA